MGVYDFYCAICGGPFKLNLKNLFSQSNSSRLRNPDFAKQIEQFYWLYELRVIGRNTSTGEAYITGSGTAEAHGWALVQKGDDQNVPPRSHGVSISREDENEGLIGLPCYFDWGAMGSGNDGSGYPVHACCLDILNTAFEMRQSAFQRRFKGRDCCYRETKLNIGRLRRVMASELKGSAAYLGGMEYFEFQPEIARDIWDDLEESRSRLPWLSDPIRQLEIDFNSLKRDSNAPAVRKPETRRDGFEELPTELIFQTLNMLSGTELLSLFEASPSVRARCDNHFWRERLVRDMPYLHDCVDQARRFELDGLGEVDWHKFYSRMLDESYPPLHKSPELTGSKMTLGVASRCRIWHCVEELLDAYECDAEQEGLVAASNRYLGSINYKL